MQQKQGQLDLFAESGTQATVPRPAVRQWDAADFAPQVHRRARRRQRDGFTSESQLTEDARRKLAAAGCRRAARQEKEEGR